MALTQVETTFRQSFIIPQRCAACGNTPIVQNAFKAEFKQERAVSIKRTLTTTLTLTFPLCAECNQAYKRKQKRDPIRGCVAGSLAFVCFAQRDLRQKGVEIN